MAACGGGGGGGSNAGGVTPPVTTPPVVPAEPGAPAFTGNVATDGLNWLNFRRSQAGLSVLTRTALIDAAALNHSNYQRINNEVTHGEEATKSGYTGVTVLQRLNHVGYSFTGGYAYGEVISAKTTTSGVDLAEELITAIYHRFVIFEPKFKEIGAGASATAGGYNYFTTNFTANNGYGPGIGASALATWPVNAQTNVLRNFLSDFESPDPVDNQNEVGYPISVHADINVTLAVTSFTVKPRGGSNLNVKLLSAANDPHTSDSCAAIIPLSVLAPNTIYDVSFTGTSNGLPISKTWSFTTRS
jgi:uncharacterized protein YkwD